jgi:hypothetical protein
MQVMNLRIRRINIRCNIFRDCMYLKIKNDVTYFAMSKGTYV